MKEILNKEILSQFPESLLLLDEEGKILFFNEGASQYSKLVKLQEGVSLPEIVPADRQGIVRNIINQVRQKRIRQVSEAEYKDPDGRSYFFEIIYSPVETGEPGKVQICVLAHDITYHKTFEKKSIQLLDEFSSLIENANALIFSVDSRAYVTEWNKECSRVTQYDKNEVLAQKATSVIDEKSHADFANVLNTVIGGDVISNQELLIRTKTKGHLTILVNATPRKSSKKNVVGVLFVGQDITELTQYRSSLEEKVKDRTESLKRALEKEKELVELRNRFVSVASHELKMPLSTIDSSIRYLENSPSLNTADLERVQNIATQVGHMKSLLEDVLTVKKADERKLQAHFKTLDLIAFLNTISHEVSAGLGNTHIVRKNFSAPSLLIESDEKLLRNIFLNLLSNAIKFSPQQKSIDLNVTHSPENIVIEVIDRGIGIDPKDLSRVFEPFNRGSNASDIKGTGLGLSIVKRAVEAINGQLHVESELNKGTRMSITIPQQTPLL